MMFSRVCLSHWNGFTSCFLQIAKKEYTIAALCADAGIRRSYHWVYYSPPDKLVMFDFQQGRDKTAPQKYLKTFKGTLQTDAYAAYNQFDAPGVTMAGCLAHSRSYQHL